MSPPKPPTELTDHCSVVYESTLYTYSANAFQSIELKEGAEWKKLDGGLPIEGGQCVQVTPNGSPDDAALFIVGGTTVDPSRSDYPGLQKWSYKNKRWDWITPIDQVTKGRLRHGATYLNSSSQILVYAGSTRGDTGPSSATFLISTVSPYGVQAFSSNAPPSVQPIVLPWDGSHAVALGGSEQNKQIFTFSPQDGWKDLGVDLVEAINQDTMQTTVVTGDDGSKVLEVYNMGVSPNVVNRIVLLTKDGQPAPYSTTVGPPTSRTKRLELDNWPEYNATYAPTITRKGFSIADASNGYAVVSGGNNDDPLCIFNQRENSWVDATALFSGSQVNIQNDQTTTTSTPTSTAAPSPSAPAVAPPVNTKNRMLTVLGATLGTIFGIAAILIIILLLLRWRKEKKKRATGDNYLEKTDRLSFADRGAPDFMKETGDPSPDSERKPWQNSVNGSHSSLAIITGRAGSGHKRGLGPLGSDASTSGLAVNQGPLGYNDPVEMSRMQEAPAANDAMAKEAGTPSIRSTNTLLVPAIPQEPRSSGWSRYFAGNDASAFATSQQDRTISGRSSTNSGSRYTDSRINSQPVQHIPPLDVKFEGQRISRVATGSPTLGHSQENLDGHKAQLARAGSLNGSVSSLGDDDHYGRRTEAWSPIPQPTFLDRPSSSTYTDSNRGSSYPVHDGNSSFFHSEDSSSRNVQRDTISELYSTRPNVPEGRESTVTVFPRGITSQQPSGLSNQAGDRPNKEGDMSWLNLGTGAH